MNDIHLTIVWNSKPVDVLDSIRRYSWGRPTSTSEKTIFPSYYTTVWDIAFDEDPTAIFATRLRRELELTLDLHGNLDARGVGIR